MGVAATLPELSEWTLALGIQIARKLCHVNSPDCRLHTIFATKVIEMPTCTHTGRFMSVPLCPGQSELACICLFVQFNNQLDV